MGWRLRRGFSLSYGRAMMSWLLLSHTYGWMAPRVRDGHLAHPHVATSNPLALFVLSRGPEGTTRGRRVLRRASISYVMNESTPSASAKGVPENAGQQSAAAAKAPSLLRPVPPATALPPSSKAEEATPPVEFVAECALPTERGQYRLRSYRCNGAACHLEPLAMVYGQLEKENVLVRVHDQCITSEVFGSKRCDCKEQLEMALDQIRQEGGVVIYLQQEGRGIGLANKIAAYSLQDKGLDTVDANRHLGFDDDERVYDVIPAVLNDLGIRSIQLMTNNPMKVRHLEELGVVITSVRPIIVAPNTFNQQYLRTKVERMAHILPATSTAPGVQQPLARRKGRGRASSSPAPPSPAARRKDTPSAACLAAVRSLQEGEPAIVVDEDGRGSIVLSAERVDERHLVALAGVTRAMPCVLLPRERWEGLGPLLGQGQGAAVDFVTTGQMTSARGATSAQQVAASIRALANPEAAGAGSFVSPGHVSVVALTEEQEGEPQFSRWSAALRLVQRAGAVPAALVLELEDRETWRSLTIDEIEDLARTKSYQVASAAEVLRVM